jgi:hypothetical protein
LNREGAKMRSESEGEIARFFFPSHLRGFAVQKFLSTAKLRCSARLASIIFVSSCETSSK